MIRTFSASTYGNPRTGYQAVVVDTKSFPSGKNLVTRKNIGVDPANGRYRLFATKAEALAFAQERADSLNAIK